MACPSNFSVISIGIFQPSSGSDLPGIATIATSWATMPEKGKVGSAKPRMRARYSNHKESSVSCNMFARWEATKLRRISTCFLTRSIHQEHARRGSMRHE